jgi:hypothetical protein
VKVAGWRSEDTNLIERRLRYGDDVDTLTFGCLRRCQVSRGAVCAGGGPGVFMQRRAALGGVLAFAIGRHLGHFCEVDPLLLLGSNVAMMISLQPKKDTRSGELQPPLSHAERRTHARSLRENECREN